MKYQCSICGYIYDEESENAVFNDFPSTWKCPLCGAPKSAFNLIEKEKKVETPKAKVKPIDKDMFKLSNGQLSALFSNLARGAEKQYKNEESLLFKDIANYFTENTEEVKGALIDNLQYILQKDIDELYVNAKSTAQDNADRGAQRICVWGEKVTRMLLSLVEQYKQEGDKMLDGLEVWVCTICGFIYIGKNAPELCPVCKVPSWKFEKIVGRKK